MSTKVTSPYNLEPPKRLPRRYRHRAKGRIPPLHPLPNPLQLLRLEQSQKRRCRDRNKQYQNRRQNEPQQERQSPILESKPLIT